MNIEHVGRDLIRFERYRQVAIDREATHGRVFTTFGLCDNCMRVLIQDGHTRFCSEFCRTGWNRLEPRQRERMTANRIDFIDKVPMFERDPEPTRERASVPSRAINEAFDSIPDVPETFEPGDFET